MRLVQWEKRIFLKKVVFLPAYCYVLHCLSHPYEVSMQILHECTRTNVLGSSVNVSDRLIYVVKNWLWQWKSRIQKNHVLLSKIMSHLDHCTFYLLGVQRHCFLSDIFEENFNFLITIWEWDLIQIDLVDEGQGHGPKQLN